MSLNQALQLNIPQNQGPGISTNNYIINYADIPATGNKQTLGQFLTFTLENHGPHDVLASIYNSQSGQTANNGLVIFIPANKGKTIQAGTGVVWDSVALWDLTNFTQMTVPVTIPVLSTFPGNANNLGYILLTVSSGIYNDITKTVVNHSPIILSSQTLLGSVFSPFVPLQGVQSVFVSIICTAGVGNVTLNVEYFDPLGSGISPVLFSSSPASVGTPISVYLGKGSTNVPVLPQMCIFQFAVAGGAVTYQELILGRL